MLVVRLPGLKVLLPSPGGPLPLTGLYALPSTILATRLAKRLHSGLLLLHVAVMVVCPSHALERVSKDKLSSVGRGDLA
jgi:hypothetical protein